MAVVTIAVLVLVGAGIVAAQDYNQVDKTAAGKIVKKQTSCPIMAGQVNTNIYVDAEGKRVYFCCNDCPPEFKKDPAKYIAQMEKNGITLDKAPAKTTGKQTNDVAAGSTPAKSADKQAGRSCCE